MPYPRAFFRIFIFLTLFLMNCGQERIIEPTEKETYETEQSFQNPVQNSHTIQITNNMGGIVVAGWSQHNLMRVHVRKTIKAASRDAAEAFFDDIQCLMETENDTIFIKTLIPQKSDKVRYEYCSITLDIPYRLNCVITKSNGTVYINQLTSDISIRDTNHKVTIERHNGACKVDSNNDINLQIKLPDRKKCTLHTFQGDVSMEIGKGTNTTLETITDDGSILYTSVTGNEIYHDDNNLKGKLGSGEAEIFIHTQKGDIKITGPTSLETENDHLNLEDFTVHEPIEGHCVIHGKPFVADWLFPVDENGNIIEDTTDYAVLSDQTVLLKLFTHRIVPFRDHYKGYQLLLKNISAKPVKVKTQDGRISLIQEAMDSGGTWKAIEKLTPSDCGNSYYSAVLIPGDFSIFSIPKYHGEFHTTLRFKLLIDEKSFVCSNEFSGSINRSQFVD